MKKFFLLLVAAMMVAPATSFAQKMTVTNINHEKTYQTKTREVNIWYQGEVNVGYGLNGTVDGHSADFGRVFAETIHGVRITKYAFVGLGIGVQYAHEWKDITLPVFVDMKGYYPVSEKFAPYVSIDLGYSPFITGDADGGLYASYGVGLNYGKLNFGLGCQHQATNGSYAINSFFVKVGLKF